jgi:hypothetical protein
MEALAVTGAQLPQQIDGSPALDAPIKCATRMQSSSRAKG